MKLIPIIASTIAVPTAAISTPLIINSIPSNTEYCQIHFSDTDESGQKIELNGPSSFSIKSGKVYASITPPEAIKKHYHLLGWKNALTSQFITPDFLITENLNLYPVFESDETLTATFSTSAYNTQSTSLGTATVAFSSTSFAPETKFVNLPTPTAKISNYEFAYWAKKNSSGTLIKIEENEVLTENITLYPIFNLPMLHIESVRKYVAYKPDAGDGGYTTLTAPTVKDYTFVAWMEGHLSGTYGACWPEYTQWTQTSCLWYWAAIIDGSENTYVNGMALYVRTGA